MVLLVTVYTQEVAIKHGLMWKSITQICFYMLKRLKQVKFIDIVSFEQYMETRTVVQNQGVEH